MSSDEIGHIDWKAKAEQYAQMCARNLERMDADEFEIDTLKAALEGTLSWLTSYPGGGADGAYDRARAALEGSGFKTPRQLTETEVESLKKDARDTSQAMKDLLAKRRQDGSDSKTGTDIA